MSPLLYPRASVSQCPCQCCPLFTLRLSNSYHTLKTSLSRAVLCVLAVSFSLDVLLLSTHSRSLRYGGETHEMKQLIVQCPYDPICILLCLIKVPLKVTIRSSECVINDLRHMSHSRTQGRGERGRETLTVRYTFVDITISSLHA